MSFFDQTDYYAIHIDILQPGEVYPFDCYMILTALKRVIPWVEKGKPFKHDRYEKMAAGGVDKVYIKFNDKENYFKFLDKYSDTEYGKSNLQGVIETNTHDGYEGIPTDIEYEAESQTLKSVQAKMNEITPSSNFGKITTKDEQDLSFGEVKTKTDEPKTIEKIEDSPSTPQLSLNIIQEVIDFLKQHKNQLVNTHVPAPLVEDEDIFRIKEFSQRVIEELIRVKNLRGVSPTDQKVIARDVVARIEGQLITVFPIRDRIEQKYSTKLEGFKQLIDQVMILSKAVKKQDEIDPLLAAVSLSSRKINRFIRELNEEIEKLHKEAGGKAVDQSTSGDVQYVEGLIQSLKNYSPSMEINLDFPEMEKVDESVSKISLDKKIMRNLANQIVGFVKGGKQKMEDTYKDLHKMNGQWMLFMAAMKKHLGQDEQVVVEKLDKQYKSFVKNFKVSQLANKNLEPSVIRLAKLNDIEFDEVAAIVANAKKPLADTTEELIPGDAEGEIPANESTTKATTDLEKENQIIAGQNRNLQKILAMMNQKEKDILELLSKKDEYIVAMESSNKENEEMLLRLQDDFIEYQKNIENLDGTLQKERKQNYEIKISEQGAQLKIADLSNQIQLLRSELSIYRNKVQQLFGAQFSGDALRKRLSQINPNQLASVEDAALLLKTKENYINVLQEKMNQLRDEAEIARKQYGDASVHLELLQKEKTETNQKVSNMFSRLESFRNTNRQLEKKLITLANVIKESRKVIGKLNGVIETLKVERQDQINSTNKAIDEFREMARKTAQILKESSDIQKFTELQRLNLSLQESEKELKKEIVELKSRLNSQQAS